MRQRWVRIGLAAAALATVSAGAGAWAATGFRKQIEVEYRQIQIKVDGQPVTVDAEPFLYLEKGRVFIPARPLAEALGAKVEWEESESTVQVYTRSHVITQVQGDLRQWSMPGAGFSVWAPLGWVRQETDSTVLLNLALPDPSGLNGLVGVTRLPEDPAPLAELFDQAIAGLRATYSGLEVTGRSEAGGKLSATATASLAGHPVGLSIQLIEAKGGNWLLFGLYPESSRPALAPAVERIFRSFTAD